MTKSLFRISISCLFALVLIDISETWSLEGHMEGWSAQEEWVWKKVKAGEVANFNEGETFGGPLDPRNPKGWPESRTLSPEFLETILLRDPYRGSLTHKGVKVVGAWFKEPIDLSEASVSCPLSVEFCRFDSNVYLRLLRTAWSISVGGSKFAGELNMNGLRVGGNLILGPFTQFNNVALKSAKVGGKIDMAGAHFKGRLDMDGLQLEDSIYASPLDTTGVPAAQFDKEVVLRSARIRDQLDLSSSRFKGKLNMNSLQVGSHLFMENGAQFDKEVALTGAKITGQLSMIASKFKGNVVMDSLRVEGPLLMSKGFQDDRPGAEFEKGVILRNGTVGSVLSMIGSTFKGDLDMNNLLVEENLLMKDAQFEQEVILLGAKIRGQLSMIGSTFKGEVVMEHLEVGTSVLLRRAVFEKRVALNFARIGGSLELSGSTLSWFTLTGTRIKDQLRLGLDDESAPKWKNGGDLFLSNTYVGVLQDLPNAWPKRVEMTGFSYSRLGGYEATEEQSMAHREVSWMKSWLEKQPNYSPQPYVQLANVLRESGFSDKAKSILYAGKERDRKEANCPRSLWLGFLNITIGYGYHIALLLVWFVVFWALGVLFLWWSGEGGVHGMPFCVFYSLDPNVA